MTTFDLSGLIRKPQPNDWTEAETAQLRQFVRQGIGMKEIAQRLGRSVSAVTTKAQKMGFRYAHARQRWSNSEIVLLRKCARENKTLAEAAVALGRSRPAVHKKACRLGISFAKQGEAHHRAKLTMGQIAEIFTLRRQGCYAREIGSRYGVHPSTVERIVKFEKRYSESLSLARMPCGREQVQP